MIFVKKIMNTVIIMIGCKFWVNLWYHILKPTLCFPFSMIVQGHINSMHPDWSVSLRQLKGELDLILFQVTADISVISFTSRTSCVGLMHCHTLRQKKFIASVRASYLSKMRLLQAVSNLITYLLSDTFHWGQTFTMYCMIVNLYVINQHLRVFNWLELMRARSLGVCF